MLKTLSLSTDVYNAIYFCFKIALRSTQPESRPHWAGQDTNAWAVNLFLKSSLSILSHGSYLGGACRRGEQMEPQSPECPGQVHQDVWTRQGHELVIRSQLAFCHLVHILSFFRFSHFSKISRFFVKGNYKKYEGWSLASFLYICSVTFKAHYRVSYTPNFLRFFFCPPPQTLHVQ